MREKLKSLHIFLCQPNWKFDVLVPGEIFQGFNNLETSGLDHAVDPVDLSLPQFQFQQFPDILLRVLKHYAAPLLCHTAQLQCPHILLQLLSHETHPLSDCRRP